MIWRTILTTAALMAGCSERPANLTVPGIDGATKSSPGVRAERRAYSGAPPVIPHQPVGVECSRCHHTRGIHVADLGFAPPSPHHATERAAAMVRCRQCHAYRSTDERFRDTTFRGMRAKTGGASRAHPGAPPTIPHPTLMRNNCLACHDGPAARESIRCHHPTRIRCRQCHVPL